MCANFKLLILSVRYIFFKEIETYMYFVNRNTYSLYYSFEIWREKKYTTDVSEILPYALITITDI